MSRFLTACAIALIASSSAAQQMPVAASSRLVPAGGWRVEYAKSQCLLHRDLSHGGKKALLSLSLEPLSRIAWMRVATEGERGRRFDGDAVMSVDGQRVPGTLHYNIFDAGRHRVREFMLDLDRHLLGRVTNSIRFWTRRHGDLELELGGFSPAWRQMNKCMVDLYAELGVSEADVAQMATAPEGDIFSFVDMPREASELDFALLYWVTAQGIVDECRLLRPSGISGFDQLVCSELMKKAEFKPARTADGQPIRVPRYEHVKVRRETFTTASPL